jgi:hypothetical protein
MLHVRRWLCLAANRLEATHFPPPISELRAGLVVGIPTVRTVTTSNATLDLAALYGVLRRAIDHAGGASAFAGLHGITASYVSDVLHARTPPGPAILDALRLRRMVTYEHTGADE